MKRILLALIFLPLAFCSSKNISKDKLLEGSPVPDQRNYKLSTKHNACTNFHKYVCSEVEDNFKLPDDRSRWTFSFTDIYERLLHAKKSYFLKLEKGYTPTTKRGLQVRDVYMSCMNKPASMTEEKSVVQKDKATIMGFKTWKELASYQQTRFQNGQDSYIGFFVESNQKDPLINDAFLVTDLRSLPERSYYKNKKLMKEFKSLLVEFFKTIGMDKPETRASWVIKYEKALAMKYPLPKETRKRWSQKRNVTKKAFLKKYPNLMMSSFLSRLPANTMVRDFIPESNKFINDSLAKTPLEQLKTIVAYNNLSGVLDDAYPAYFKKAFDFRHTYLGGSKVRPPRQERCTKLAMGKFGMELDKELMPVLFPDFPTERVVKVGESIRQSIINGLNKNTWLSKEARDGAIKKTKHAKLFLVKPLKAEDWDFMPIQNYSVDKPYANMALYNKTKLEKNLKELGERRNPARWDMSPLAVNAYYNPPDNKFVLLQGILQPPFFDPKASDIENIAAIGTVVGHELGHGIDDQGSKWNYKGEVKQWMKKSDIKTFKAKGASFINQFNKIGHDGTLTLGENIGDHVGLTFAYDAAFPDKAKASKADKKKFFAAYARMWCSVATPAYEKKQLKTNPHSLGRARINQQVIHLDGFYEAYDCKPKDKMFLAKKKRIRVW